VLEVVVDFNYFNFARSLFKKIKQATAHNIAAPALATGESAFCPEKEGALLI